MDTSHIPLIKIKLDTKSEKYYVKIKIFRITKSEEYYIYEFKMNLFDDSDMEESILFIQNYRNTYRRGEDSIYTHFAMCQSIK